MERFFDDPDSITKEDMLPVIRKATIAQTITQ
jgi:elongation factor G